MPTEKLCEPCKKFLRGHYEESPSGGAIHHCDAKSFEEALQLPCLLCSRAWAVMQHNHYGRKATLGNTIFMIRDEEVKDKAHAHCLSLILNPGENTRLDAKFALVPWDDISTYGDSALPSKNTGSQSAIAFLHEKYRECLKYHDGCGLRQSNKQFYPSRLIDVGVSGDDCIYLRESMTFEDKGPYFCLSHCWGETQPYTLTKATASTLREGLSISLLPKTFQDAITVTRKLQVRFLWIDSLCIFQDNIDDWSTEAGRMRAVYSQAACTIAATAAKGGDEGLFYDRDPELLQPFRLNAMWTSPKEDYPPAGTLWCDRWNSWDQYIELAPLNQRAWVAQERQLSPRTMHFGSSQLFWECYEGKASEIYPRSLPEWAAPNWTTDAGALKTKLQSLYKKQNRQPSTGCDRESSLIQSREVRDLYVAWGGFRICYSGCNMTKEEDKLVALLGITEDFEQVVGDQLIAGLWRNHLLEELCWFTYPYAWDKPSSKLMRWRAPSWSWASTNQRIWTSNTTKFHYWCSHKEIWSELRSLDVETRKSGQLIKAAMNVKCRLMRATINYYNQWSQRLHFSPSNIMLDNWEAPHIDDPFPLPTFEIHYDDESAVVKTMHVYMFIIQRCAHEDTDTNTATQDCVEGLLLTPVSESASISQNATASDSQIKIEGHLQDHVFKRIAIFTVRRNKAVGKIIREHEACEERVITLV